MRECNNDRGSLMFCLSNGGRCGCRIILWACERSVPEAQETGEKWFHSMQVHNAYRSFTLDTLIQTQHADQPPPWIAYMWMDLKAACDSLDREALWCISLLHGWVSRPRLSDPYALWTNRRETSEWFTVQTGRSSGFRSLCGTNRLHEIIEPAVHCGVVGATIGTTVFTDLDYADDVSLLAKVAKALLLSLRVLSKEANLLDWRSIAETQGLVPNHIKTSTWPTTANGCRRRVGGC